MACNGSVNKLWHLNGQTMPNYGIIHRKLLHFFDDIKYRKFKTLSDEIEVGLENKDWNV